MREVLSTSDINSALENVKIFKGAYPSDLFDVERISTPKEPKDPQAYIINTADSNHPGENWIALVLVNNKCLFFDSFGHQLLNLNILFACSAK